jgi:tRNA(Ile)-lysidine synthase
MNTILRFKEMMLDFSDIDSEALAIAVSGGSDSLALCLLMQKWLNNHNRRLICITIDHQLRKNSYTEAQKVGETLKSKGLEHHIIQWTGSKPSSNIQENARIARYELLTDYCNKHDIKYLLTGHQQDDQAENFLLRAEHGSGLYGLSGIPKVTEFNNIKIIRPLLNFTKAELQDFLKKQNIEWTEDPSNLNDNFTRVKIRKILSQHPEWNNKFAYTSNNLSRVRECIEYMLNQSIDDFVTLFPQGYASIKTKGFNLLPQEIRFRLIERVLQTISIDKKPPRGERIERLLKKIENLNTLTTSTLAGCLITLKKDILIITREYSTIDESFILDSKQDNHILWDHRLSIFVDKELSSQYNRLIINRATEEDWPELRKKLTKEQLSIPKAVILGLPAIRILEKILAIPHINYYINIDIVKHVKCEPYPQKGLKRCYTL